MKKLDILQTIKTHYVWLTQESEESFDAEDTRKESFRRQTAIQDSILREDIGYFQWLLDELIKHVEHELKKRGDNSNIPVMRDDQHSSALETLVTEELLYVSRLILAAKLAQENSSMSDNTHGIQKWVEKNTLELMGILKESKGHKGQAHGSKQSLND